MKINKGILFVCVVIIAVMIASFVGSVFFKIFNIPSGFSSFIVSSSQSRFINGLLPSYILLLTLLFTIFGGENKYKWLVWLLFPVVAVVFFLGSDQIFFAGALGLIGWLLGWGIGKLVHRNKITRA